MWLDLARTNYYREDPVYDPSGMDLKCLKLTLQISGVVHDRWWGGGKADGSPNPPAGKYSLGMAGWSMPVSLANLRETLMRPRGILRYYIGSTLVLESPQRDQNNVQFSCDVQGGPFPQDVTVTEIVGTRAAMVTFKIETFVSDCNHFVLSNRWRMQSDADDRGYTTNIINGQASLRLDFLKHAGLQVDDFRKWLILSCEPTMKRDKVGVVVSEDGSTANYTVIDRNVNYGTGIDSGIADIQCQVTGGMETPLKSNTQWIKEGYGLLSDYSNWNKIGAKFYDWLVPVSKMNIVVRIWGMAGVSRQRLLSIAASMMMDRLGDPAGKVRPVASIYATVDWSMKSPPFVELRAECMAPIIQIKHIFLPGLESLFHWDETIAGGGGMPLNWNRSTTAAQLPLGNNTRALWVGRLISQALTGTLCQSPAAPPEMGASGRSVVAADTDAY